MLSKYGNVYVYEKDEKTASFLKEKFKKSENIEIIQKPNNNNKEFFDLILAADVIEHVEDDEAILQYLSELLNKNGQILITVPAFNFLFSSTDFNSYVTQSIADDAPQRQNGCLSINQRPGLGITAKMDVLGDPYFTCDSNEGVNFFTSQKSQPS